MCPCVRALAHGNIGRRVCPCALLCVSLSSLGLGAKSPAFSLQTRMETTFGPAFSAVTTITKGEPVNPGLPGLCRTWAPQTPASQGPAGAEVGGLMLGSGLESAGRFLAPPPHCHPRPFPRAFSVPYLGRGCPDFPSTPTHPSLVLVSPRSSPPQASSSPPKGQGWGAQGAWVGDKYSRGPFLQPGPTARLCSRSSGANVPESLGGGVGWGCVAPSGGARQTSDSVCPSAGSVCYSSLCR